MQRFWLIFKTGIKLLLILMILGVLVNKLHSMAQIRGLLEGAASYEFEVTDKKQMAGFLGGEAYWIAWNGADINERSSNRLNLFEEQWVELKKGDRVTIIYLPDDPIPYHRDGIFASDGNFALDFVLIGLLLWWVKRIVSRFTQQYEEQKEIEEEELT